mmetsp:Transcript_22015/g.69458  ORF Transcript_22015/g.69458 Transcript_22015/m.69458 type:complete len:320 (-) Transcript_22015:721-1680(-)
MGVHPRPEGRPLASQDQGCARGHSAALQERALHPGEHRRQLLLAHKLPGDAAGAGLVPHDGLLPEPRAEANHHEVPQGDGQQGRHRWWRPPLQAPRLRLPRRLLRGVCGHGRLRAPGQLPGQRHHGGADPGQEVLRRGLRWLLHSRLGAQHHDQLGPREGGGGHEEHAGTVPQRYRGLRERQLRRLQRLRELLGHGAETPHREARRVPGRAARQRGAARHRVEGPGVACGQVRHDADVHGAQVAAVLHPRDPGGRHRHPLPGDDPGGHEGGWLGRGQPRVRQRRGAAAEAAQRHAKVRLQVFLRPGEWRGRRRRQGPHH